MGQCYLTTKRKAWARASLHWARTSGEQPWFLEQAVKSGRYLAEWSRFRVVAGGLPGGAALGGVAYQGEAAALEQRWTASSESLRHPALERDSQRILLRDLSVITPFTHSWNAYQHADVEHNLEQAQGAEALPQPLQGPILSCRTAADTIHVLIEINCNIYINCNSAT